MKYFNIFDKETKVLLTNVTVHDSASSDDIARAANDKVNRRGYNLTSVKEANFHLIIEEM